MTTLSTRWIALGTTAPGPDAGSLLERVLQVRGIPADERGREILLAPRAGHLHAPRTLPGATEVAQRLEAAVRAGRPVAVYGDYDADGITATAVLMRTLRAADPAADIRAYIPDRIDEGYGLNEGALEALAAQGVRTVVTVDCGVTAVEPARRARELGLELLITDHHTAEAGSVAPADAVAHPALPEGPRAPFEALCGAAVAFKVASEFARLWCGGERVAKVFTSALSQAMPLVAMGTVADVVPLVDENRVFVARGLAVMRTAAVAGVTALLEDAQLGEGRAVEASDVGFRLGPRLNAIGRLGHAREAVELLLTDDLARARALARVLAMHNERRRELERAIFEQACERVDALPGAADAGAIVLADARWHEGVVGIVAQKIAERYGRPAILMSLRGDGTAKGSGRSVEGVDILAAVHGAARGLLLRGGGHAFAVGVTVREEDVPTFAERVAGACAQARGEAPVGATFRYEAVAAPQEFTREAVEQLQQLAPFGRGNPDPVFLLQRVRPVAPPQCFGADRRHLEIALPGSPRALRAVWWGGAARGASVRAATGVDLLVKARIDSFRGRESVQLVVVDARPSAGG
ncbi:MAG: single-stranded-DNA-specific exonuclease RecJ [Phycisphaerales bacterium]